MIVPGIMEHIEEAGIHSGDSACAIPPYSLPGPVIEEIRAATVALAKELNVIGLMNVQFAVRWETSGSLPSAGRAGEGGIRLHSRLSTCSKSIRAPAARCRSSRRRRACRWRRSPPR